MTFLLMITFSVRTGLHYVSSGLFPVDTRPKYSLDLSPILSVRFKLQTSVSGKQLDRNVI